MLVGDGDRFALRVAESPSGMDCVWREGGAKRAGEATNRGGSLPVRELLEGERCTEERG